MNNPADFQELVRRAMEPEGRARMQPVIEKELLHYDILFALHRERLLSQLTFQGGTSLRLCYGAPRFSEDLDFAGGRNFDAAQLKAMKSCIEHHIGERYGLEVTVKEPHEVVMDQQGKNVTVLKWQIRILTSPDRPDRHRQMIKVEVANVRALTRVPQSLQKNYDFLPDGYTDMPIMVESREEIMADKLVALVDCPYLRHRDIWDLRWLRSQGAQPDQGLIRSKLADYRIEDYAAKADNMISRLPQIVRSAEFKDQMSRFLTLDVQERTLLNEDFLPLLQNDVTELLAKAGGLQAAA